MTPERKVELAKKGWEEDPLYSGVMWAPLKLGNKLVKNPEWMRQRRLCNGYAGIGERSDYLGKAYHFRKFCDCFFSDPDGLFHMEWNPNAVKIVDEFFANKFLAVLGAASEGKSYTVACIAAGMYLLDPKNTKVLVTSTTMESAKGKVWGDISYAWDQVEATFKEWGIPSPGKKMSSHPIVRYEVEGIISHKAGIELIPTQQTSEKQSVEKVQGYKNQNVIFLGDEWDTLPPGLVKTIRSNLSSNRNSRCVAAYNPTGRFTPGGIISKPLAGWDSISEESTEWYTEYGKCIRFDGRKSPNVLLQQRGLPPLWHGITTQEILDEKDVMYGPNKPAEWWVMVAAWFPPTGELSCIYSEAELTQSLADHEVSTWIDSPVKIAGLDPSFVHGGDQSILTISQVGLADISGHRKIVYEKLRTIILDNEITDKTVDKDLQVVRMTKKHLELEGVQVKNLGVDITGAPSFSSLLNLEIGTGWLQVHSSSSPTNLPISKSDTRKCVDVFDSLMSELWYVGRPLIREGQVKGLDPDLMEEMCSRTYTPKESKSGKTVVEPKKRMKFRTGKSPDRSDSNFVCLHVARVRHHLSSTEKSKSKKPPHQYTDLDRFYEANPHMLPKKSKSYESGLESLETGLQSW